MENQSKYIMIERNKFAALVKAHRKCLQILSILTYAHTVKEVQLTFTLEEICELLQMTREEVETQRQKGYIRFSVQNGITVYEITADGLDDVFLPLAVYRLILSEQRGLTSHVSRLAGLYHREDATNVLTNNPTGPDLVNGTEHVRPEVTAVLRTLSPAGNGKGLAWETSCEDVDPSPSSPKIRSCNIRITFCMAEPVI